LIFRFGFEGQRAAFADLEALGERALWPKTEVASPAIAIVSHDVGLR
jgi:hypothetical protein